MLKWLGALLSKKRLKEVWLKKISSFVIFTCLYLLFLPLSAGASGVAQVDQAKVRLIVPPGGTKTGVITLDNPTQETKSIRVYLEDWIYLPSGEGTKDFKSPGTSELSAASWISFSPTEFTLTPFARQVINYTVKVPAEARGGHYAVMFFENYLGNNDKSSAEGVNVNFAIRVASLFYIECEGTIRREVALDDFSVTNTQDNNLQLSLKLTNIGNVDVTAKSTYFILDKSGTVQARGEFNDAYTFPGMSVALNSAWKDKIKEGKYDLILSIDIGCALEELGLGRGPVITKETKIEFGSDGKIISIGELR